MNEKVEKCRILKYHSGPYFYAGKGDNMFRIDRTALEDPALSTMAKNIYFCLQCFSENYPFTLKGLRDALKAPRTVDVAAGLGELVEHGYVIECTCSFDNEGDFCSQYNVLATVGAPSVNYHTAVKDILAQGMGIASETPTDAALAAREPEFDPMTIAAAAARAVDLKAALAAESGVEPEQIKFFKAGATGAVCVA